MADSRFRSPEHEARYLAAYQATLALWPVPHESREIETRFGMTHINVAGAPDLPPLILIPGAQIGSTVWYPNVEPLSRHFRVYAVDVVDQTGLSVPTRKLKTPQDSAEWLSDVLDGLNLKRVTMVGHSQGCWQILNLAKTTPARVERMVLLSPALPFARLKMQMLLRILPVFVRPTRRRFYSVFQWMTTMPIDERHPHPLVEQFMIGPLTYGPKELGLGVISMFSDDELRGIDIPALVLIGDHEVVVNAKRVMERARLMPRVQVEEITNAGHLLPVDQANVVNARVLAYLEKR